MPNEGLAGIFPDSLYLSIALFVALQIAHTERSDISIPKNMSGQPPPNGRPFLGPPFPGGSGRVVFILPPGAHPPIIEVQPGDVPPIFFDPSTGAIWDPIALPTQHVLLRSPGLPFTETSLFPNPSLLVAPLPSPSQVAPGIHGHQSPGQQPRMAQDPNSLRAAHEERIQLLPPGAAVEDEIALPHAIPGANPPSTASPAQAPIAASPSLQRSPPRRLQPTPRPLTIAPRRVHRDGSESRPPRPSNVHMGCEFDPAHPATEVFRGGHYCNDCLEVVRVSLLQ